MSTTLRRLAASTAIAMVFGSMAHADEGYKHPLVNGTASAAAYVFRLSDTLAQTTGDDAARIRARAFAGVLEATLMEPSEETRIVVYPKENSTNMLVVAAVVPPKGFEALPIPVCAQQHNKVVGTWNITSKGEVIPRPAVFNPEGSTRAACNAFVLAARAEINERLAQLQQKPDETAPAPTTTATVAAVGGATVPRFANAVPN